MRLKRSRFAFCLAQVRVRHQNVAGIIMCLASKIYTVHIGKIAYKRFKKNEQASSYVLLAKRW